MRQEAKGAGQQLLLSLDNALENFSFQYDAHTVLLLVGYNFLAHWADTDNECTVRSTYPLARLTSDGSGQKIVPEKCFCGARFEGAGIVRK